MRQQKGILFDYDGTLVDSRALVREALRRMTLVYEKKRPTREMLKPWVDQSLRSQMHFLLPERADEGFRSFQSQYVRLMPAYLQTFAGVMDMLEALSQQGYVLGLVSNNEKKSVKKGLGLLGLDHFFSVLICREDVSEIKPHQEGIVCALDRLSLSAEDVMYVGDSFFDLEAARKAKVASVLATWKNARKRKRPSLHPQFVIHTPEELVHLARQFF